MICLVSMALLGMTNISRADLVEGFETPDVTSGGADAVTPGLNTFDHSTDWTVVGTFVHQHDTFLGPADSGTQYLDLLGPPGGVPGSITTTFSTVPGVTYAISFAYADNPFRASGTAMADVVVTSTATPFPVLFMTTVSHTTSVLGDLDWTTFSNPAAFVAADLTTMISFATTDSVAGGILLDSIAITAIPEAQSWVAMGLVCGVVGLCYGFRALRRNEPQVAV
jgi:hypothetical protein